MWFYYRVVYYVTGWVLGGFLTGVYTFHFTYLQGPPCFQFFPLLLSLDAIFDLLFVLPRGAGRKKHVQEGLALV